MPTSGGSSKKPNLQLYADTPVFNTKAVVQQTGVPAPTLRAWERRYKLLSPERAENTYRLYTERDIMVIRWLKERVDAGMAISQAVALFRFKDNEQQRQNDSAFSDQSYMVSKGVTSLHDGNIRPLDTPDWQHTDRVNPRNTPIYNMHLVRERLVAAFNQLDESVASTIMGAMMAIYSVEQVCSELITPTMWQIGQFWADGIVTISVEHFACNFFRALLTNMLHVAPIAASGPLAIVCCAPGEPHELAPLMLSLFLRRSGIRIVYLGQNIASKDLLQTVHQLTPALLCVSVTMPAYLADTIDLAHHIAALPRPRPLFAFGGQGFAYSTHAIPQIPGIYLSGDLQEIVVQLHNMITKQTGNKN